MVKLNKFKTFESGNTMKTKSFKDMYNWGTDSTPKHTENELEVSEMIIRKMNSKGTPNLDWIHSKGYSINVVEGSLTDGLLDHLGMIGMDYTFYLVPSWTKESFLDHLDDNGVNEEECVNFLNSIGLDIDDLPIYGKSKDSTLWFGYDERGNESASIGEIIHWSNDMEDFDLSKVTWKVENEPMDIRDECPLWGSKVPLRFNQLPLKGSTEYNSLCEYGLIMIKFQIGKLILSTGINRYEDLESSMSDRSDIISYETEFLIRYMNKSDIHVTKNEDLMWAKETSYNLYKGYKLFHENHKERQFKIPKSFVSEFLKQGHNDSPF